MLHGRFYVLIIGGLHEPIVRFDDTFNGTSSVKHVTLQPSQKSNVVIRVHKDLEIHLVPKLAIEEGEDPLKENDFRAFDLQTWRVPLASFVVVVWNDHILALKKLIEGLSDQWPIHGIRMVEVVRADLFEFLIC